MVGVLITANNIRENGLNWSNGTDLFMEGVAFVPFGGWAISGLYFLANAAVKYETGKSIGDHLGDVFKGN